jgi:hypothetical protein
MKLKFFIFAIFIIIYICAELFNFQISSQNVNWSFIVHLSGLLTGLLTGPFFIVKNFCSNNTYYLQNLITIGFLIYILITLIVIIFNSK